MKVAIRRIVSLLMILVVMVFMAGCGLKIPFLNFEYINNKFDFDVKTFDITKLFDTSHVNAFTYENADNYEVGSGSIVEKVKNISIYWVTSEVSVEYGDVSDITFSESANKSLDDDNSMRYLVKDDRLTIQFSKSGNQTVGDMRKKLKVVLPRDYKLEELSISTVSGEVYLASLSIEKLTLESVSSDVRMREGGYIGECTLEAVSGEILIYSPIYESFDMDTVSANAEIVIPEELGYTVDVESVGGKVYADSQTLGGDSQYTKGDGKVSVDFETVGGSLYINK